MKTDWIWLLAAGAAEVGWVAGLNAAATPLGWAATLACMMISLPLLLLAARNMAATTVYAIFVGLGAMGAVVLDIVVFGAALHGSTFGFLALLLAGIVGLKLTAENDR